MLLDLIKKRYSCRNFSSKPIPDAHMVLAALEHGAYSTWISSVDCERAGEIIGVRGYLVTNLIAFGYPETPKAATPQKPLEAIVFNEHFGNLGMP